MSLDDLLVAWQSQDDTPLYGVNRDVLRLTLRLQEDKRRRALRLQAAAVYIGSAGMFAFLALAFLGMFYDDDPRTWWDFVIALLGAAAALFWGGHLYLTRKKLALRERGFGASLRDDVGRHLALIDYELSLLWQPAGIGLTNLAVGALATATILVGWRINNEPFEFWMPGLPLLAVLASVAWSAWAERRKAERNVVPRKRRLEALLQELDGPG